MKLPSTINKALQKPMDRREFFKHIGIAGLLVVGGGLVAKSAGDLIGLNASSESAKSNRSLAYGASPYGGKSAATK